MQTKFKDGKWKISTSKTEMDKLYSIMGWLKPLTELSTPVRVDAEAATAALDAIRVYLEGRALPTTEEN